MLDRAERRALTRVPGLVALVLYVRLSGSQWWPVILGRFVTEAVEDAYLCATEPARSWAEVPECIEAFWSHGWRHTVVANPSIPRWLRR